MAKASSTSAAASITRRTHFRFRWKKLGGHVHVRVFTGPAKNETHGKNGDLTFQLQEWDVFFSMLSASPSYREYFEFVQEDSDLGADKV